MQSSDAIEIAWVIGRLNIGGPAIFAIQAAQALRGLGFQSTILTGETGPEEGSLEAEARARGVPLLTIPTLRRAVHPVDDLVALREIGRHLARLRPAVVQTQTAKAGALGRIAARALGCPVIVHTFHGHVFEGYFSTPASRAILLAERALSRIGHTVAISERLGAELEERYRIGDGSIPVLPLGIELRSFLDVERRRGGLRAEIGLRPDAALVGYAGRLVRIKAIPDLIEAMRRVRALGVDAHLALAGDGDQREAIERESRRRGEGWVHLLGWREPARLYADSEVVALASHSEGTPLMLMEAMASARAVVATRVGGVVDVVDHGRTGVLVGPGEPEALAREIGELLRDPSRRRALGSAARAEAVARFDIEAAGERLAAFYREKLAARLASRR